MFEKRDRTTAAEPTKLCERFFKKLSPNPLPTLRNKCQYLELSTNQFYMPVWTFWKISDHSKKFWNLWFFLTKKFLTRWPFNGWTYWTWQAISEDQRCLLCRLQNHSVSSIYWWTCDRSYSHLNSWNNHIVHCCQNRVLPHRSLKLMSKIRQ